MEYYSRLISGKFTVMAGIQRVRSFAVAILVGVHTHSNGPRTGNGSSYNFAGMVGNFLTELLERLLAAASYISS